MKLDTFQMFELNQFFWDFGQMIVSQVERSQGANIATIQAQFEQFTRFFVSQFSTTTFKTNGTVSQI